MLIAFKGGDMAGNIPMKALRGVAVAALLSVVAACAGVARPEASRLPVVTDPAPIVSGTMRRYQVRGRWYQPAEQPGYDETGLASWYGEQFNGRPTATGERFDMHALTAAHKTLPLPGLVEVTNLANGRRIVVRVNDRGPFVDNRIIDLSRGSAEALGMLNAGAGEVRVRYLGRAPRTGGDDASIRRCRAGSGSAPRAFRGRRLLDPGGCLRPPRCAAGCGRAGRPGECGQRSQ